MTVGVGVVAGLAAQTSLANVFVGLQLAFTDAIRVDDVVGDVADPEAQPARRLPVHLVVRRGGAPLWRAGPGAAGAGVK